MSGAFDLMVVLYVRDMDRALAFWRDGVGLPVMDASPGWSRVGPASGSIGLHLMERGGEERPVPWAGPNFQVETLEPAVERAVAAGANLVEIREAISRVPVRLAVMLDPEGNGFEFRQPV